MTQTLKDFIAESAKASPPIAVVTASLTSSWTLNDTLTTVTIFYVLLQAGWLIWRWRNEPAQAPAQPAPAPAPKAAAESALDSASAKAGR